MWVLRSQKTGDCYHLLVGQTYSVGRKDTDILIKDDPSISRKHALLTVTYPEENMSDVSKLPALKVQDADSKYGTFRNGSRIQGEEILSDGDNVKFGQFESVFSASYAPLVITTSCIDSAVKKELKKTIHRLGGHLVSEWKPECTHLVMSDVKVTIKAVCCLISLKPLVTPAYFMDMLTNISSRLSEPITNRYIPPIGEDIIDKEKANFDIVPERKRIFDNKTFIFLDRSQFKKMHFGVTLGGGIPVYLAPDSKFDSQQILKMGTCIVQPHVQGTGVSVLQQKILDLLQRNNKRMIQESDFGLAVAYCSTEIFCNPDSSIGSQFGFSRLYSQSLTQQELFTHGTSRNDESSHKKSINLVSVENLPSIGQSISVEGSPNFSINRRKRKIRDSPDHADSVQQSSKQTKLEKFVKVTSSKPSNPEPASNSINIEGIALYSSSVKEEPRSGDEMEVDDNNSVTVESPATKHKSLESSKVSSTKENGFLNSKNAVCDDGLNEHGDEENDLPRNLIQVEYADLVCRKPNRTNTLKNKSTSTLTAVKNFKRFRKVLPLSTRLLPQIIGGHELEPYSRQASKALDDILNDSCDVQPGDNPDDDDIGEFDWESQSRQRKL